MNRDPLFDTDDLSIARPLVWLVVIWILIVAAIAMILAPALAHATTFNQGNHQEQP